MARSRRQDASREVPVSNRLPSSLFKDRPTPAKAHSVAELFGHEQAPRPERTRATENEVTEPDRVLERDAESERTEPHERSAVEREQAKLELSVPERKTLVRAERVSGPAREMANKLATDFVHPRASAEKILQYWRNWSEDNPRPALLKRADRKAHGDYETMFALAYNRRSALEEALPRKRLSDYVDERAEYGPLKRSESGAAKAEFRRAISDYYAGAHDRLLKENPRLNDWASSYARKLAADPGMQKHAALVTLAVQKDERVLEASGTEQKLLYVEAAIVASVAASKARRPEGESNG